MIEQGLFKKYFVGRDGFYWWIGQIAPEASWRDNKIGIPGESNKDTPGFGERYKVRIMGHHTAVPSELSDDELPWATVMYPVTAGGGTGAASQTANLRQGMFVFGFFMDGEDGQQPVIMGVVGTNSYTAVMANVPDAKFIPFTGTSPQYGERTATYALKASSEEGEVAPVAAEAKGETTQNSTTNDSVEGQATEVKDNDSQVAAEEKTVENPVPKPSKCEPVPLSGLQLQLSNMIKEIEKKRKSLDDERSRLLKGVSDEEGRIKEDQERIKTLIMQSIKWFFDEMQASAEFQMNLVIKELEGIMNPNETRASSPLFNGAVDNVICILKNIFEALFDYLTEFVEDLVNKVINVARCFVENFVGAIVAQVDNLVTQAINAIVGAIEGAINGAFGLADAGLSTLTSAFTLVQDILSLLSCESDDGCKEYRLESWNMLTGGTGGGVGDSLDGFLNAVDNFQGQFTQVFDFALGITDVLENQFSFDLDSVFDVPDCDIGPILCGPPSLTVFGGTGAGFAANPVISESGSIIGVDVVSIGKGYQPDDNPYARVVDACGNGNGGTIIPIVGTSFDDLWDYLTGNNKPDPGDDNALGQGQRGVLSPFWEDRRAELDGGGAGGGAGGGVLGISPAGDLGSTFTGTISGDRLNIEPLVGVVTVSLGDTGPIETGTLGITTVLTITGESLNVQIDQGTLGIKTTSLFTGNISQDSGRLNLSSIDTISGRTDEGTYNIADRGQGGAGDISETDSSLSNFISDIRNRGPLTSNVTQPILPGTTDGVENTGIIGMIIKDPGSGYLRQSDGSLGGMNRTWSRADQTNVRKPDGTYLLPSSPGSFIRLEKGDVIETPSGTKVVTEPSDDGTGGGEEIIGGSPYIMKNNGNITAPSVSRLSDVGDYPMSADGTYPVIMYLGSIVIDDPGIYYEQGDEIIIEPSHGAKAELTVSDVGSIRSIKVTEPGEGFKEMPNVYIKSKKGVRSKLLPQLGVNRVSAEAVREPGLADKIIQVVDTVGGYA